MIKVVWRFNLANGIGEAAFFPWLRQHVWASSATYGCATYAYRLPSTVKHRYATEALWPSQEARNAWAESDSFRAIPNYPGCDSPWGAQTDLEATVFEPLAGPAGGLYDGLSWGDLVRFQTSGPAGNDGLEGLPREEQLLDLAAFFAKDAGYFAARAQQYFHQRRGRPWGGSSTPEQLEREMRRSLAWFLGHLIGAGKHLEADILQEFADWSAEIGMELPRVPYQPLK